MMTEDTPRQATEAFAGFIPPADVIITDQLFQRTARQPDYVAEARTLHSLGMQMAADPKIVLQNLAEAALRFCGAGSAGVSLLERSPEGNERLRIAAAAGEFAAHRGEAYSREGSCCGHCLLNGEPQLYVRPGRGSEAAQALLPASVEHLVLRFRCDGAVTGTVWAIAHDDAKRFDAEDVRLISGLADFSAAALRLAKEAAELRDRDERLRTALEAGKLGTFDWDMRTGRIEWSENQERLHGLEPGTFDGTFESFAELIHPDDLQAAQGRIETSLHTGQPYRTEFRIKRLDGTYGWLVGTGVPRYDDQSRPIGIAGVCSDITDRMLGDEALRRAERTSRFLADASSALAAFDDAERTLAKVAHLAVPDFADWCAVDLVEGDAMRRLEVAHVDPSKVELAREIHRRFPASPDDPGGAWHIARTGESVIYSEIDDALLLATIADPVKLQIVRDLGLTSFIGVPLKVRDKTLGVLTFASSNPNRRFDAADLAIAQDLARRAAVAVENVRLYEEVAEAARRKDEFLAMLGHELRNPLAPIRSGLELLALSGNDRDIVELMSGQVDHLVRLVDDLLDVSRIVRGRVELKRGEVELADVVRRAAETVRPLASRAKQELRVSIPQPSPLLDADPVRLTQVFSNLLNNASKYGRPGGRIHVSAILERDHVVTRVTDDGIGIDPELQPHVFELFTQSTRTIDRAQGGLGLGLTIVKNLVEMHGGTVTVRSGGAGTGCEFSVRLPLLKSTTPVAELAIEQNPDTACRKILVVDDNVPAAKLLVRLLGKLGAFDIVTAHDGESAISAAEAYRPDLILLDIGLPKMDGYEVARRLRRNPTTEDSLLIALTGYGSPEDRQMAFAAGFDEHLVKPPGIDMLRTALAHPKLSGLQ